MQARKHHVGIDGTDVGDGSGRVRAGEVVHAKLPRRGEEAGIAIAPKPSRQVLGGAMDNGHSHPPGRGYDLGRMRNQF